eukprot:TRINITY_DN183_c1_g1_i2.p1 TRINITY_DN183_c1_g1~~TRINITY_DN183_c1_g1_i2.p1  ORF type:complete len:1416 (+),score=293.65 TRINITY_DN183_c1_g1_i2:133-4380(+)
MSDKPLISGWITKRGAFVHSHKLRFAYLYTNRLEYYDKPLPQGELKGSWPLEMFSLVLVNRQKTNNGWIRLVHDTETSRDRYFEPQDNIDNWLAQLKALLPNRASSMEPIVGLNPNLHPNVNPNVNPNAGSSSPATKPNSPRQRDTRASFNAQILSSAASSNQSAAGLANGTSGATKTGSNPQSPRNMQQDQQGGIGPNATSSSTLNTTATANVVGVAGQNHAKDPNRLQSIRPSDVASDGLGPATSLGILSNSMSVAALGRSLEPLKLPTMEETIHVAASTEKGDSHWRPYSVKLDANGFAFPEFFIEANRLRWAALIPQDELYEVDENENPLWAGKYGMSPFNTNNFDAILLSYWEDSNPQPFHVHKIVELSFISIPILVPRKKTRGWLDALLWYSNRDWNWEYQELRDLLRTSDMGENPEEAAFNYSKLLSNLVDDFELQAMHVVRTVVTELSLPDDEKRIISLAKDIYGREIYQFNNILFKLSVDGISLLDGHDWSGKMTANEFRAGCALEYSLRKTWKDFSVDTEEGVIVYNSRQGLFFSLSCVLDYCGYRVLAIADPGFTKESDNLIYGPSKRITSKRDPIFMEMIKRVSSEMNLSGQCIRGQWFHSSSNIEGYKCSDGRYYVTSTTRLMPPQSPEHKITHHVKSPRISNLCWQLRPEFIKRFLLSSSSDALTPGQENTSPSVNAIVGRATLHLINHEIPMLARLLHLYQQYGIPVLMHLRGINIRFLGLLAQQIMIHQDGGSKETFLSSVLTEMVRRALKQEARSIMRQVSPPTFQALSGRIFEFFSTHIQKEDVVSVWVNLVRAKFEFNDQHPMIEEEHFLKYVDRSALFHGLGDDLGIILSDDSRTNTMLKEARDVKGFQATRSRSPYETYEKAMATVDLALPDSDSGFLPPETRDLLLRVSSECFLASLKSVGLYVDGFNMIGLCLNNLGEHKEAESSFQTALFLRPFQPEPLVNLADLSVSRSTYLASIYALGAMIKALDYGTHVESMSLRVLQQCSSGYPILRSAIDSAAKKLGDDQVLADIDAELQQIDFGNTDQLLQQSVIAQLATLGKPHKPLDAIRSLLRSKCVLKSLVSACCSSPLAVVILGKISTIFSALRDTVLGSGEDWQVLGSAFLANKEAVDAVFKLVSEGSGPTYGREYDMSSIDSILQYYGLQLINRLFDTEEGRSLIVTKGISVLLGVIHHHDNIVLAKAALSEICMVGDATFIQRVIENYPTVADDVFVLVDSVDNELSHMAWMFLRNLLKNPTLAAQLTSNTGSFIRRLLDFVCRLTADCEQISLLKEASMIMNSKVRVSLANSIKHFLEFSRQLFGSGKAEPNSWRAKVVREAFDQKLIRKTLYMASCSLDAQVIDLALQVAWNVKENENFVSQLEKGVTKLLAKVSLERKLDTTAYAHDLNQMSLS